MRHLIPLVFLFACGTPSQDASTLLGERGRYEVDVLVDPNPPAVGDLVLTLWVADPGGPVSGCVIDVMASMPEHGHGGMEEPSVVELGDGAYEVSWNCMMAGHWQLAADLSCPGGTDRVVIDVDVH